LAALHGAELGRLREDLDRERIRLAQTEHEREEAEHEREEAQIRWAAAEGEVKGLREALDEARRPFWRRWMG
jgi:uncharacterized protein (DUF3084 family)